MGKHTAVLSASVQADNEVLTAALLFGTGALAGIGNLFRNNEIAAVGHGQTVFCIPLSIFRSYSCSVFLR